MSSSSSSSITRRIRRSRQARDKWWWVRLLECLARVVGQMLCGSTGHDMERNLESERISLRCRHCGYSTPGWSLTCRDEVANVPSVFTQLANAVTAHLPMRLQYWDTMRRVGPVHRRYRRQMDALVKKGIHAFDADLEFPSARMRGRGAPRLLFVRAIVETAIDVLDARARQGLSTWVADKRMREYLLREHTRRLGIDIRYEALDRGLPGCLVSTRFGRFIYVNDHLPEERKEWVALHELGHYLLDHKRANSEYALDPALLDSKERMAFSHQEYEANRFASCCQRLFTELVDHLGETEGLVAKTEIRRA